MHYISIKLECITESQSRIIPPFLRVVNFPMEIALAKPLRDNMGINGFESLNVFYCSSHFRRKYPTNINHVIEQVIRDYLSHLWYYTGLRI